MHARCACLHARAAPTSFQPSAAPSDTPTDSRFFAGAGVGGSAVQDAQKKNGWLIALAAGLGGLALVAVVVSIVSAMLVSGRGARLSISHAHAI
jgi:hypothetical protein